MDWFRRYKCKEKDCGSEEIAWQATIIYGVYYDEDLKELDWETEDQFDFKPLECMQCGSTDLEEVDEDE